MKRMVGAIGLSLIGTSAAFAAFTPTVGVPEMDGGFALAAAAVVMGVGAVVYEKYFRR